MLKPSSFNDYELIDFGKVRKLERFGSVICNRPEPSAQKGRDHQEPLWKEAALTYNETERQKGNWEINRDLPDEWTISYKLFEKNLKLLLKPSTSKHVGVFPEQAVNWDFIYSQCQRICKRLEQPKVLNLFAYTGAASLAASMGGASVTHVDSSSSVVQWAKKNGELNDISNIRWIVEDAKKFVQKSIRRGDQYQGVIMDPPIFGLAKKGAVWKLNRDLQPLIEQVLKIMDPDLNFFVLNTYSPQLPIEKLHKILSQTSLFPKNYDANILGLEARNGKKLPLGNLIRYAH